ncbi:UDP-N-acetylglucosamine 1-carboxyvinyltransferase [Akkermansia glycaniphila]|uniref:UDP-N-acetylglucosamine 1-carboxyvinyltransferase n=1 Tax=Akkermansia glycaniphila TaxID=1679444 RepID=A0A1C7PEL0_9BACT|nr:UDP-N-acetylglucosamine 1-carboxyvinyltransferase [Akkermansia glycaniphila]MBT9449665.1 UDP-N-acetylglucosamine 1-carboxyvinyltransferase [Akkermansia glycaniphila]OCA02442.1 UDP-N-acetylglucosamine 1-carboxyvinyltransferase [Akkermansia glycaniphila]SEI00630.1 rna 3'-terminal phosphate cyclase/enolpyruvate transferase alpha/beta [Akkermansia glycaniphila]
MEKLIVHGGYRLRGAVSIGGSKNAVLPILAASLLTDEPVHICRVPDVSDANYMLQILLQLGADVERSSGIARIQCTKDKISSSASYEQVRKMRASICLMGPLMARLGKCTLPLPGGCVIGDRPVDLHIRAIQALGAQVEIHQGNLHIHAPNGLKGTTVDLRGENGPTVLGTDNLMMAAVLAEGTTVIESAACEPEVVDLANFLNNMGAKIEGAGTSRITITGVEKLHGCVHTVIPDRIETGTFMVAAALMGDGVTLRNVCRDHIQDISRLLTECGHKLEFNEEGDTVTITPSKDWKSGKITTAPYPGFPTDMQAQMTALFALTPGISIVKDTIFPQRFMHCSELKRMGADIKVDQGTAIITGVEKLSGAPVMASDLRASAALVLAALAAEGTTEIRRLYHLDRGYEMIADKLLSIGAAVKRSVDLEP